MLRSIRPSGRGDVLGKHGSPSVLSVDKHWTNDDMSTGATSAASAGHTQSDQLAEAVVAAMQREHDLSDVAGLEAELDGPHHDLGQCAFRVEQLRGELTPLLFEVDRLTHLVAHLEPRRHSDREPVLREQPTSECVECRHGRFAEDCQRGITSSCLAAREHLADSRPQLCSGLLGERDRRDLPYVDAGLDQSDTRSTSTVVLPEPAPASTKSVLARSVATSSLTSWSVGSRDG